VKITIFQHVPFETPGSIESWALDKCAEIDSVELYDHQKPTIAADSDLLILMGGPMSVNDHEKYPWLANEKRAIEKVLKSKLPILGICLGAQLIANVLGSRVFPNNFKEIGWYPVEGVEREPGGSDLLPDKFEAFHWHGETFDIPDGARHIARSEACENQAFIYKDRVAAFQFHLETTPSILRRMITSCGDELDNSEYVQSYEEILEEHHRFYKINGLMNTVLDRLVDR